MPLNQEISTGSTVKVGAASHRKPRGRRNEGEEIITGWRLKVADHAAPDPPEPGKDEGAEDHQETSTGRILKEAAVAAPDPPKPAKNEGDDQKPGKNEEEDQKPAGNSEGEDPKPGKNAGEDQKPGNNEGEDPKPGKNEGEESKKTSTGRILMKVGAVAAAAVVGIGIAAWGISMILGSSSSSSSSPSSSSGGSGGGISTFLGSLSSSGGGGGGEEEEEEDDNKKKMKAPGRNGEIINRYEDFERDPRTYFQLQRLEKKMKKKLLQE